MRSAIHFKMKGVPRLVSDSELDEGLTAGALLRSLGKSSKGFVWGCLYAHPQGKKADIDAERRVLLVC